MLTLLPQVLDLAVVAAAVGGAAVVLVRQLADAGRGKKNCRSGCGSCAASQPPSELVQIGRRKRLRK